MGPQDGVHSPERKQISRRKSIIGILLALILLGLLGGLTWYLTHSGSTPNQNGPGGGGRGRGATTVGIGTAEYADIPVNLEALGTVTASATATVRPQVSGILQKVLFTEGQMVKEGQVLASIDPRQFEMSLLQATGQRQRDEAQLENAKLTLQRYKNLLAEDSIAKQEVDTQAALVKQLEGTVKTDKAVEGSAKLNLDYTRIVAPISGRVGLRTVDIGNLVSTGDTNGVAVITQLSPIDVEFAIPQDRVPELRARINENASMEVTILDRNRTTVLDTGKFLALDNQADTTTGTVKAKARFSNKNFSLFPSQFVNVRLLMRTVEKAVVVPVNALRHSNSADFVYVLNQAEKTVAMRTVKTGVSTVDKVQLVSGINEGEKVITEGADRLRDGAKVTLPGDKPTGNNGNGEKKRRGKREHKEGENANATENSSGGTEKANRPRRSESANQ